MNYFKIKNSILLFTLIFSLTPLAWAKKDKDNKYPIKKHKINSFDKKKLTDISGVTFDDINKNFYLISNSYGGVLIADRQLNVVSKLDIPALIGMDVEDIFLLNSTKNALELALISEKGFLYKVWVSFENSKYKLEKIEQNKLDIQGKIGKLFSSNKGEEGILIEKNGTFLISIEKPASIYRYDGKNIELVADLKNSITDISAITPFKENQILILSDEDKKIYVYDLDKKNILNSILIYHKNCEGITKVEDQRFLVVCEPRFYFGVDIN